MSFRSAIVILLVSAAAAAVVTGQGVPAPPGSLTLLSPESRQSIPTSIAAGREMVALSDLARVFGLTVREDTVARGLTVSYKDKTIVLTPDQSVASVDGRLVSLPAPIVRDGGTWLVPVEFIARALARIYDAPLDVRPASRLVLLGNVRVPRVTARQEALGVQARVTLDVAPGAQETVVQEPGRILVRFEADALDATLPSSGAGALVESIQLAESGKAVAINVGSTFGSYRATTTQREGGTRRIVLDIMASAPTSPEPAVPEPAAPPLPGLAGPPALRTVVVDPGHGGGDTGVRGPGGTLEKDVTLTVARRLKGLLERGLGVRVLLTRDADAPVPPDERAALANNNKAGLFISLHANGSLRQPASGAQVYYLDPAGLTGAGGDEEKAGELLPVLGGGFRLVDVIPWEMAQMRFLAESAELAGLIEEELGERVELNTHSVQQGPFRVLVGANMPAVLVEMGFLTNPAEEAMLVAPGHQGNIAQALYDAIARFRDRLEAGTAGRPQ